jgi:hypothetical protein
LGYFNSYISTFMSLKIMQYPREIITIQKTKSSSYQWSY